MELSIQLLVTVDDLNVVDHWLWFFVAKFEPPFSLFRCYLITPT